MVWIWDLTVWTILPRTNVPHHRAARAECRMYVQHETGRIPEELSQLEDLEQLFLADNGLEGETGQHSKRHTLRRGTDKGCLPPAYHEYRARVRACARFDFPRFAASQDSLGKIETEKRHAHSTHIIHSSSSSSSS